MEKSVLMGGRYARKLRRIWGGYRRKNPDATEGESRSFLERMKRELGDRYITYQAIGLALQKLAPIDRVDENEKIRSFWRLIFNSLKRRTECHSRNLDKRGAT